MQSSEFRVRIRGTSSVMADAMPPGHDRSVTIPSWEGCSSVTADAVPPGHDRSVTSPRGEGLTGNEDPYPRFQRDFPQSGKLNIGREKEMITLTKETIENAKDYIPVERKHIWCRNVAAACVRTVAVTGENEGSSITVPDRYEENTMARQMALASMLAQNYLGVFDEEKVLQGADYDEIMGSHLVNQLERLKGDKEVRDKIFNILYDYGEVKKMLNAEIYSRLGHLNDTLTRILVAFQSVRPGSLDDLQKDMKDLGLAVKEIEKRRAGRVAGDTAKATRKKTAADPEKVERAVKMIGDAGTTSSPA